MLLPPPSDRYDKDNEQRARAEIMRQDAANLKSTNPIRLTGTRLNPEEALANLITLLAKKGILTDGTTAV